MQNLTGREAIIFDFDGTIADTKACIMSTATKVLTDWGVPAEQLSRVGDLIGPPFPQAFEQVFGLSEDDAIEVTRRYRDIYNDLGVDAWPAFPGMVQLLEELRDRGKLLAVASSKRAPLVLRGLEDNGMRGLFDTVRARDSDGKVTKADAIRLALADLEAAPARAVMVGDRFHDVEAAIACGIPCIGVLYGDTAKPGELEDAGAVAIASTVDELRSMLLG